MPAYGKASQTLLATCHPDLQRLFSAVIEQVDCTILEGHRSPARQALLLAQGKTKVKFGKHNVLPSRAVDVAPHPVDWTDRERFTLFAGFVRGVAHGMGIRLRWGGDWDGDWRVKDNEFDDLVHFELADPEDPPRP